MTGIPGTRVTPPQLQLNQPWLDQVACSPDPCWTTHEPSDSALQMMRNICAGCPVRAQCADYALELKLTGAVYAGVYVPTCEKKYQSNSTASRRARRQLRQIAGREELA